MIECQGKDSSDQAAELQMPAAEMDGKTGLFAASA